MFLLYKKSTKILSTIPKTSDRIQRLAHFFSFSQLLDNLIVLLTIHFEIKMLNKKQYYNTILMITSKD